MAGSLKPAPLKPGDLVAVVAPAGPVHEEALAGGIRVLENQGFRVALGANLRARRGYLAGPDEGRAEDLNRAFADPDVRGIFCARGGYGTGRILDLVDFAAVRQDPKVFVGYSDITALHLALARKTGLVTFHGPGVESLGEKLTRFTLESFLRAVTATKPLDVLPLPEGQAMPRVLAAGRATGRLTGGNLSLISALIGTPYELEAKGRVIVLEDVGEQPYRVDRMLCQLALAGKLSQAAGVVVGEMVDCEARPDAPGPEAAARQAARVGPASVEPTPAGPPEPQRTSLTLEEALADHLAGLGRPVVYGLPCGHGRDKLTLPLGVAATVDGYKARLIIEEAACRAV